MTSFQRLLSAFSAQFSWCFVFFGIGARDNELTFGWRNLITGEKLHWSVVVGGDSNPGPCR